MKKIFYSITFLFFITANLFSQSLEKLKLSNEELPKEYKLTDEPQCQAVQACSFYKQADMYRFIGKIKTKEVQNFESKEDN